MKKHLLLLICVLPVALCCNKGGTDQPLRPEYITVYETSADKTVNNIQVPFEGVQDGQIHVLSNVQLQWKYLVNQNESGTDWLNIKSVEEIEPGHTVVTYDAESILPLNSLERRGGNLSFSCPSASIGKFLSIAQGYQLRFYEEFSDKPGQDIVITGKQVFITDEYPVLNADYYDYISFNAWAVTDNDFLTKNITLDVTVSGGLFYATGLKTYRINIPVGTAPSKDNLQYLLLIGDGERMSAQTKFTFSTSNDDLVYVHIDNFAAYKVTEAEMGYMFDDEEFNDEEEDWI